MRLVWRWEGSQAQSLPRDDSQSVIESAVNPDGDIRGGLGHVPKHSVAPFMPSGSEGCGAPSVGIELRSWS